MNVVETSRRGSRPEQTAYELTADGETEFVTLLRESLWTVSSYPLPLYAGLAFVTALRREEVLAAMRNRVAQVDAAMASLWFVQTTDLDAGHAELLALSLKTTSITQPPWESIPRRSTKIHRETRPKTLPIVYA